MRVYAVRVRCLFRINQYGADLKLCADLAPRNLIVGACDRVRNNIMVAVQDEKDTSEMFVRVGLNDPNIKRNSFFFFSPGDRCSVC